MEISESMGGLVVRRNLEETATSAVFGDEACYWEEVREEEGEG
jgi:hypothetical protein